MTKSTTRTTSIYRFMLIRLRDATIAGIIISIIIFLFLGKNSIRPYYYGLLLGLLNFAILTLGLDLIIGMRLLAARVVHFLFFTLRYLAIAIAIVFFIKHRNANVFVVVGGLLTMNFSLFLSETIKHLLLRKEG